MNWDNIQNISSNIVFGILLLAMTVYWISLFFLNWRNNLTKVGRFCALGANFLLFFILSSRWIVAGYFPLSNLYKHSL